MNIFVSYFASKAPKDRKVCIAKKPYRFLPGLPQAQSFAPSNPWAKNWQEEYRADLENRFPTPESLRLYLEEVCEKVVDPILCCYEKNPAECHRSILVEYIREKLGMEVPEWSQGSGPAATAGPSSPEQFSLS